MREKIVNEVSVGACEKIRNKEKIRLLVSYKACDYLSFGKEYIWRNYISRRFLN